MIKFNFFVFTFLILNATYSQNKVKESICKIKLDSIISNTTKEPFFKKNVKFDMEQSLISVHLEKDSIHDMEIIFINFSDTVGINKFKKPKNFSSEFFTYKFFYKGCSFHERVYTCEFVKNKNQLQYQINQMLLYYEKIENKEYLSPKKVKKIARSQGFKKICYQSLTPIKSHAYGVDGKIVWQLKECINDNTIKIVDIDPESGKILNYIERSYTPLERATYRNILQSLEH